MNSEIRYSIIGGDPLNNFTINAVTGNITNMGPLDFETQPEFTLVVMAMDQGAPSLNTTKVVKITIMVHKCDILPCFAFVFHLLYRLSRVLMSLQPCFNSLTMLWEKVFLRLQLKYSN